MVVAFYFRLHLAYFPRPVVAIFARPEQRMQFETLLDELTDAEIKILTATAQALLDARTDNEGEN